MNANTNTASETQIQSKILSNPWEKVGSISGDVTLTNLRPEPSARAQILKREIPFSYLSEDDSAKVVAPVISANSTVEHEVIFTKKYEPTIELFGDHFILSQDPEGVFLYHPIWTLSGSGDSLEAAMVDLKETIQFLRHDLDNTPTWKLDANAFAFREYLHEKLTV
jgi:hypothetical protein